MDSKIGVHRSDAALLDPDRMLPDEYVDTWQEWSEHADGSAWDVTVGDGLPPPRFAL
jgi:hypothetical protein